MSTVIKVENLSKYYRLGLIGSGTLSEDVNRWIAKMRGKPDPLLKVGEKEGGNRKDGQIWALQDINLQVQQGEILGIIGRNGAGKSTLLKILSRITAPTEGKVKIKGRVGSLLEVGTGFHSELTGRENIYLNGAILGMSRNEITHKLDEIIEFAEMSKFIDTPVKRYSSGMTVRLAFAVAAHLDPEILIVDEVLAVGDAEFQKKCLGKIKDVSRKGRTVLFVSHDMGSLQQLCTSGLALNHGHVAKQGEITTVISYYLNKLGSRNTNLSERLDHSGTGEITVTNIELQDFDGQKISEVSAGSPVRICFKYKKQTMKPMMKLFIGIRIDTDLGQPIIYHHNKLKNDPINLLEKNGEFICDIESLPLVAGKYKLTYSILNDQYSEKYIDSLSYAIDINVIDSNYYGNGLLPKASHGLFLINAHWK